MTLFLHRRPRRSSSKKEDGYVLMILLLLVAMIIIGAAAIVPTIKYEIEHDREEELIHRGVQYSRAIRGYYKKFGRYPVKIEDLQNTNNMRFLRKRYKDPMNCHNGQCEDFKLLHFGEVKLTFGNGLIPGALTPGMASTGALAAGNLAAVGGMQGSAAALGQPTIQPNQTTTSDSSQTSSTGSTDQNSGNGDQSSSGGSDSGQPNLKGFSSQTLGGGPIVGVVSASKKEGYREFNKKKKYSEWQFIYDPGTDRGGLLMTPNQPVLFQQPQNVNGQPNSGTNPASPGGLGFQNNPVSSTPNQNAPATPDQNNAQPQQQ
ncbi:MAG TPA: hypothetical protein VKV39_13165 [Candidatus Sulfotelmatobacter sp.]|nr:hypothetical protein [Candidatus Sulfotelmatobacter sp.]